jgi:hypothetical protein
VTGILNNTVSVAALEEIFQQGLYTDSGKRNKISPSPFSADDAIKVTKASKKNGKTIDPALETTFAACKSLKLVTNLILKAYDIFPTLMTTNIREDIFLNYLKDLRDNELTLSATR